MSAPSTPKQLLQDASKLSVNPLDKIEQSYLAAVQVKDPESLHHFFGRCAVFVRPSFRAVRFADTSLFSSPSLSGMQPTHTRTDVVMKLERTKWLYVLETYIIFPALTSPESGARIAEAFLKRPEFQFYIFPLFSGDTPLEDEGMCVG